MNKQEEHNVFSRFISVLNHQNEKIKFRLRDRPDIELTIGQKRIGVEITEIMDGKKRSRQILIKQIGKSVVNSLSKKGINNFHLNLNFGPNLKLSKSQIPIYAKKIAGIIFIEIGNNPEQNSIILNYEEEVIDDFIGFNILFSNHITTSYFSESSAGFVPDLELSDLKEIISKKERSLLSYQPYEEQWLLVVEGNFLAGSIDKVNIPKSNIKTSFDKLFIYRQQVNQVVQLK